MAHLRDKSMALSGAAAAVLSLALTMPLIVGVDCPSANSAAIALTCFITRLVHRHG